MSSDFDYYRERAIEERQRAADASDENIANIHRLLADKYEALARKVEIEPAVRPGWDGTSDAQPA